MTVHPVHPADLSAYYDGALPDSEKVRLQQHVATCPECRAILDSYCSIGRAIRSHGPEPVPFSVDRRVRAMVRGTPASLSRRSWLAGFPSFRPALAGVAVAAILLVFAVVGLPFGGSEGPKVASAYLYAENDGQQAIEVQFTGAVDREAVQQSVQMDPPMDVSVTWRGDTLVVHPAKPLQKVSYTLSLKPKATSNSSVAAPVAFDVPSADIPPDVPSTPVALPTKALPVAAAKTSTPAASPTAQIIRTATSTPTLVPYPVVRSFALLFRAQPAVAASLGAPREAEHAVQGAIQPFQKGLMLSRGDRKEIIVLRDSFRWQSYPDAFDGAEPSSPRLGEPAHGFGKLWRDQADVRAALGGTIAAEAAAGLVIQEFERGTLLWTPDRTIYVLFAGGLWERYADAYQDPTPALPVATTTATAVPKVTSTLSTTSTPTVAVTPSPTPEATQTAEPSPTVPTSTAVPTVIPTATAAPTRATTTPTATPAPATPTPARGTVGPTTTTSPATQPTGGPTPAGQCKVAPVRGLGLLYNSIPTMASRLGCALAPESSVQVVRQFFEHGQMVWRSDTNEIMVLPRDSGWAVYKDTWQDTDLLSDAGTPPAGLTTPVRDFGKLWRLQPDVRAALGWATADSQPLSGVVQEFAGGRMLWTSDRSIYVLYTGGNWQSFQDSYTGQ